MHVTVELPLEENTQSEVFLHTHNNGKHGMMEGVMSRLATPCQRLRNAIRHRLNKCVAGLLLLLLLAGHVATLAYAYHQQGQSDVLHAIAALCSVLALLLTGGRASLQRAWLAVHVTYSDDLARGALRVLKDLQAQPLLHAIGLGPPDALDTLAYWWWVLQGLLLATLASFISGPSAPHDDNPDDDNLDDDNPDRDFEEGELREVVVMVEVEQPKYNNSNEHEIVESPPGANAQSEVFLQTHSNNKHGTVRGIMSRVSTPCQRLRKAIMRCLSKCVAGLLLAGHVATLAYAYHQQGQSDVLRGIAALCSVLVLPPLALLLPSGSSLMRWAWLAVHVTYSDDFARGALRVLSDLQALPLLHALGLGLLDDLDTLTYWWWFLQGLLLPTLTSFISGPTAPNDENPDDDDTDDDNPDGDNPDDDDTDDDNPDGDNPYDDNPEDDPDRDLDPVGEEEVNLREVVVVVVVVEAVDWQFRVGALVPPPDSPYLHPRGEEEGEDEDEFEDVDWRELMEAVEEGLFGVGALAAPPEPPAEEEGGEEDVFEEVDRGEVVEVVEGQSGVGVVAAPPDPPARHPGPVE